MKTKAKYVDPLLSGLYPDPMRFARRMAPMLHCSMLLAVCWQVESQPTNAARSWNDYRTIMWIGDTANRSPEKLSVFYQRLREMGINTAMVFGDSDPGSLVDHQFPYYVENMVNRGLCLKFNSKVVDWDRFVTEWVRDGRSQTALVRDYCLNDPGWLNSAQAEVERIVRRNKDHQPLAYNIRDELSTTISANPFDYDFNPITLNKFRVWLQQQYGGLDALNTQWESHFLSWDEVKPFTTDQIKNRMASGDAMPKGQPEWHALQQIQFEITAARQKPTRWNFAPWADFRTYMDVSLALSLDHLRQAAHALDPSTPVGIEGTQMPDAFGGYDLWRLSQVLDWVEPYDIGGAREIFGSFMPGKPILTTVFESESNPAFRRLWHLLLEGDKGCLVWWSEDCIDWKSPDWQLTAKAKALQPVLHEMTSPLARLFLRALRERDPIYILYSQASIQVDWLIESTVDGSTWLRRFSSFEADHNQMAKTRTAWLIALEDLGYSPQFLSSEQLEKGSSVEQSNMVAVLPNSWALSEKELRQLERLRLAMGSKGFKQVLTEGPVGIFDEHGTLRRQASKESPWTLGREGCAAIGPNRAQSDLAEPSLNYLVDRLKRPTESRWFNWLKAELKALPPTVALPTEAHARVHRFRTTSGSLLGIERNIAYQMSEDLKQAGGNQPLEEPIKIEATLQEPGHVYDLRTAMYIGYTNRISFTLDPWRPSLFAVLRAKIPADKVVESLNRELEP